QEGGGRVYVGRPVSNTRALVLDDGYRPVPLGIPGELYLAGEGVTRGYLGRPALTAERYLPDPSGPAGGRMYRVMDRVRWSEGGELEYIERVDHQVKIRGYRVELGEIEAALGEHAGVGECAVTAFGEGDAPRELVAYWVPATVDAPSVAELRGHLKGRLPGYMVPTYFVVLRELPRTPNGKVDRRALPAPHGAGRAGGEYVPPRNETETALAAIWREVLGVERVGVHDSFFDLGGHSLKATQVVSRVREALGTALPIRAIFEAPTLAELALRCGAGGAEAESAIARVADEGGVPLSFAQERLWFLDRMEPGQSTYNIPFALRVDGALDADALERAIAEVVRRHDQLRASFREVDGRPVQVFAPAGEFRLRVEDLSHLPLAEREAEVERRVHADAVRPFDLARGPLFRGALLRLSARDHVLSLNFHHAVSDGWSFGVFFREVTQLYSAFQAGRPSPLPELEVQYADYAAWQRTQLSGDALAADVEFWRAALAGAPPLLELPTDRPRPAVQTYSGATMTVAYPAELSERLGAVARAHGASLFQALLAAFHALIARYSGQDDVVVGTPLAGRMRPETEALIGFFINTLPVRGDLGGDPTFRELLGRTREATLGVYAHQELPFEKLVEELQPERSLAYGPYFQVLFGLQNRGMSDLRLGDLAVRQVPVGATDSKLDLGFSLADTEGGIAGSIEYNPDLFDADTIRRMSARYLRLLQAVADDPDARVLRVPLADADELAAVASFASSAENSRIAEALLNGSDRPAVSVDDAVTDGSSRLTLRGPTPEAADAEREPVLGSRGSTRIYVLGAAREPLPVGMPGEIWFGGIDPIHGSRARPGTADRFAPDPFAGIPGALMYRTGDRGRWLLDGSLEPMGRMGEQVTLRGTRIALGDVEAALAAHPHVARAVAVVRTDGGDRRLAAYVVPREGAPVDADEVRVHAARVLPEAMVPAAVVVLPALPLMANGRVDRGALPAPAGFAAAADEYVEPATATERALAALYAELLGARKVGAGDDFFALGGHSLLATRLVSRIRAELGAEIALRTVFQSPSVAALAALVDAAAGPRTGRDLPLAGAAPAQDAPLSFAQERLWFLDQMEPGSATYNLPITLRLRGALDADALRRSLGEIARRHEVLRAVFRDRDGRPVQRFQPADGFALPVDDISGLGADALEAEIAARVRDESLAPFSLADGPLFRAELLRAGPADHVLLVNMHHAVSDGWSIGILVRELTALYAAFSAGRPSPLAELPVRYADFAAWQRGWLTGEVLDGQVAFWRRTLDGAPALLELTTDRPRPAVQTYRGANFDIAFPGGLLEPLAALARTEGASVFMALMGAFQVLMARYSGQDDVVVGTPIAGRNRAELEGLIGFFVNTLPIRGDLAGDPTFRHLLRRVREATLDAYAHQDLPFEKLVAELHPERSLSHGPVFQVMFTLQNLPPGGLALGDVAIEQVAGQEVAAKYDLAFTLAESDAGLGGSIQYNPDLFDTATIERMAAHFGRLLAAFAADPDARVWRVPLMDAEERTRVVESWNATAAPFPATRCVHELFADQALRTPHAPAVEGGGAHLTYAELDAAANRLAHRLRARGVGPEVPVAVSLDRSPEMVVALLAVLKAGGAYLPLDPAYPLDRR
ncbi:MAG TPA: condensation domain-containing protein, partial [Longimicrobiaceae bacterium]|nr:condensation domain-containing protein [Longimicrobiaceae bacterium]